MPLRKPSTAHPRILGVYSPPLAALERAATMRGRGAIAQLGERLDRTQEVGGSSPPSSIPGTPAQAGGFSFGLRLRAEALLPRCYQWRRADAGPIGAAAG